MSSSTSSLASCALTLASACACSAVSCASRDLIASRSPERCASSRRRLSSSTNSLRRRDPRTPSPRPPWRPPPRRFADVVEPLRAGRRSSWLRHRLLRLGEVALRLPELAVERDERLAAACASGSEESAAPPRRARYAAGGPRRRRARPRLRRLSQSSVSSAICLATSRSSWPRQGLHSGVHLGLRGGDLLGGRSAAPPAPWRARPGSAIAFSAAATALSASRRRASPPRRCWRPWRGPRRWAVVGRRVVGHLHRRLVGVHLAGAPCTPRQPRSAPRRAARRRRRPSRCPSPPRRWRSPPRGWTRGRRGRPPGAPRASRRGTAR